jgi:hypothetical protein
MKFLVALVLLILAALGGYAAYWFVAAERIKGETDEWAEARQAEGWAVARETVEVRGFPGAHRIVVTGLDLTAPPDSGGWAVMDAALRIDAGSPFDFNRWTVRPQSEIRLRMQDGEEVTLSAASSHLELETENGPISHFHAEAQALSIVSAAAPLRSAESAIVQGDRVAGAWRVLLESRNTDLADAAFGDAQAAFGDRIALLTLDLQAQEEGLAALAAGFAGLQDAGELSVNAARLEWGAAVLDGQGALGVDTAGRLRGAFDVALADAEAFLRALADAGALDAQQANVAVAAISFFPRDEEDRVVVPFTFRDGETLLGPVAIGPAPLVLRQAPGQAPAPTPVPQAPAPAPL